MGSHGFDLLCGGTDSLDILDRLAATATDLKIGLKQKEYRRLPDCGRAPNSPTSIFSRKVFVGGLPTDCSAEDLTAAFVKFGSLVVSWPSTRGVSQRGYAFLIFENPESVRCLVASFNPPTVDYFMKIYVCSRRSHAQVQVRVWNTIDAKYIDDPTLPINSRFTVFVGGILRTARAIDIAYAMQLYGPVAAVTIDTDNEYGYPKGAARVTFRAYPGYVKAMLAKLVTVCLEGEKKMYEIKPYLIVDAECEQCYGEGVLNPKAKYFCAEVSCLSYYCEQCWDEIHFKRRTVDRIRHNAYIRSGEQLKIVKFNMPE